MNLDKESESPIELYRYMAISGKGFEYFEDILRNNRVWFSRPGSFNDPFDCNPQYRENFLSREEVVKRQKKFLEQRGCDPAVALEKAENAIPGETRELETWMRNKTAEARRLVENTGVFCMTTIPDSLLMWSHYAERHTGICIKFEVLNENGLDFIGTALPVEYSSLCPLVDPLDDHPEDTVKKIFLTKSIPYSYEREWRIIQYKKGNCLISIPRRIITGVILGVRIDEVARERISNACSEYDGGILIQQAHLDPKTYGLGFD